MAQRTPRPWPILLTFAAVALAAAVLLPNPSIAQDQKVTQPTSATAIQSPATSTSIEADSEAGTATRWLPAAPSFTWRTDYCSGWGRYTIGSSYGATYYQVWASYSSSFVNPYLRYSGSNQSGWANWGPAYLRARACNASGCSGWSGQRYARYYSICL